MRRTNSRRENSARTTASREIRSLLDLPACCPDAALGGNGARALRGDFSRHFSRKTRLHLIFSASDDDAAAFVSSWSTPASTRATTDALGSPSRTTPLGRLFSPQPSCEGLRRGSWHNAEPSLSPASNPWPQRLPQTGTSNSRLNCEARTSGRWLHGVGRAR